MNADNIPAQTRCNMPYDTTFESFEKELSRLVESFGKRLAELRVATAESEKAVLENAVTDQQANGRASL